MKVFSESNARFTVIENGVIRMEYAKDGIFVDEPTLFALRSYTKEEKHIEASAVRCGGALIIETPLIKITYKDNGKSFSRRNLTARLKIGEKSLFWYPAMKNKANLGGAVSTLDGCSGPMNVPEGIIARDGWHTVDDSKTSVLKDGWISERSKNHICDLYLFVYGNDYKGALSSYAAVSGKSGLPRKYTFGSWYSRWHPYTADDFRAIIKEYDENDFPLDILVIDMDWHHHDWQTPAADPHRTSYGYGHAGGNMGWTGYSWNNRLIPDPAALLTEIKNRGLAVTLNDHPADGIRSNEDCYGEFAELMGLDGENGENIPFDCGNKKYMEAFFKCALEPNEKLGVDFWWLDWQQDYIIPEVPGVKGQKVLPWLNYLYFEHSRRNGKRGASYSRWGGPGDQKHPMFFSGDSAALWEAFRFEIENTVASANSMCFWWGHDIGGFAAPDGKKEAEMYIRWVQFGITSAALKLHSCWDDRLDRRPWTWDEETCGVLREMFHLRSRLFPAIYSAAYSSYKNDLPYIEPLYFEYPDNEEAYLHPAEYFIGGKILCAPVYTAGDSDMEAESEVWLPDGVWYNFFNGEKREGRITERSGIRSFPMYIKAGMPLPMQPYTPRMASTPLEKLCVRIYLPEDGCEESFPLYEDDGISEKYMTGDYLLTNIICRRRGKRVSVEFKPEGAGYEGMVETREISIELCGIKDVLYPGAVRKNDMIIISCKASSREYCKIEFDLL